MPLIISWTNLTAIPFHLNLTLKMPSTAYAETLFFKKLKAPPRNLSLHMGLLFFKKSLFPENF